MTHRGRAWPNWAGGVTLVLVVGLGPGTLAVASPDRLFTRIAAALAVVASVFLLALVAPLAGANRRRALWALVPFWGIVLAWQMGCALAAISRRSVDVNAPTWRT